MIADINITEKSFGSKVLMTGVKFSIDNNEKVGIVGRNGVGKSTLFGILTGADTDYTGSVTYRRGASVVATAQEHFASDLTVMEYILQGLPEYPELQHILKTYPDTMGSDLKKIDQYTEALERYNQKGFYQVEELVAEELKNFQMEGYAERRLTSLSGGQKRLVEVVKIMHADADLALLDEPTNHMDYVAKKQFIDWLRQNTKQAMLIITHDRDVLSEVDRIVEIKDGEAVSYRGNYDAYLKQNAMVTAAGMNNFEQIEKRIANLRQKVLDYQRLKEKSRNPGTIQRFKRLELRARAELAELEQQQKPTFWIDKESAGRLDYKSAERYGRFKAKNIRVNLKSEESRSKHVLVRAEDLAMGYGDKLLFEGVNIDLREGEAVELRGRNGAGKTTLIRGLLAAHIVAHPGAKAPPTATRLCSNPIIYSGELFLDPQARVGIYEQEIDPKYLDKPLGEAIEAAYLAKNLPISETKVRQLCADYLFTENDRLAPLRQLSGGQKARFQLINMLACEPQLLILDEPTNHLDLPSIEELETALAKYSGAILYVSHDDYFRNKIGGTIVNIGGR